METGWIICVVDYIHIIANREIILLKVCRALKVIFLIVNREFHNGMPDCSDFSPVAVAVPSLFFFRNQFNNCRSCAGAFLCHDLSVGAMRGYSHEDPEPAYG